MGARVPVSLFDCSPSADSAGGNARYGAGRRGRPRRAGEVLRHQLSRPLRRLSSTCRTTRGRLGGNPTHGKDAGFDEKIAASRLPTVVRTAAGSRTRPHQRYPMKRVGKRSEDEFDKSVGRAVDVASELKRISSTSTATGAVLYIPYATRRELRQLARCRVS